MNNFLSRSAVNTYTYCGRKRYLAYHAAGGGIAPKRQSIGLTTGSLVHTGLNAVAEYAKERRLCPQNGLIQKWFDEKFAPAYREEILARQLIEHESSEALEFEIDRQVALATGLVMIWSSYRLRDLLEDYSVRDTEREVEVELPNGQKIWTKIDMVMERDGALHPFEFKTKGGGMNKNYKESFSYSSQTLLHTYAIEQIYGVPCAGVHMEFLLKGMKRRNDKHVTGYNYYSPILLGLRNSSMTPSAVPGVEDFSKDNSEDYHPWNALKAKTNKWTVFNSWEEFDSISDWIEIVGLLGSHETWEELLDHTIVHRSEEEVDRWIRQVGIAETAIDGALEDLNPQTERSIMDTVFPGNFDETCFNDRFGGRCSFCEPICFGTLTVEEALASGEFIEREPHYKAEKERRQNGTHGKDKSMQTM